MDVRTRKTHNTNRSAGRKTIDAREVPKRSLPVLVRYVNVFMSMQFSLLVLVGTQNHIIVVNMIISGMNFITCSRDQPSVLSYLSLCSHVFWLLNLTRKEKICVSDWSTTLT